MRAFAALLDRLSFTASRNAKLRLIRDHLADAPDPDRGWALAALTGALSFTAAKPAVIRQVVEGRVDPELFRLSYDYVGDLAETVALIWPARHGANREPELSEVIDALNAAKRGEVQGLLEAWLDALDADGRWALLKLVTGGLRVGVSARLAWQAAADFGGVEVADIQEVWHAQTPPYADLMAWLDGRTGRPSAMAHGRFRPVMLAQPIDEAVDLPRLDPGEYAAEWKWDGIRVQAVSEGGVKRLYSRTGEDVSGAFPDVVAALAYEGVIDGELLVLRDGRVAPFGDLQQRLNRKTADARLMISHPAGVRAYDLLAADGEDLRALPFAERRKRLEGFVGEIGSDRIDLSPLVPFRTWEDLAARRAEPPPGDSQSAEGLMLKRLDSLYEAGRPRGPWFKWKRDPHLIDAVLMYAQRGHGKRSSFYSDYTFGVWTEDADGVHVLTPVGKAYFGFTDEELKQLDRFVRENTVERFGPVRSVTATREFGLVLEVAFEGLQRSKRHKSGVAMRFPRISRIRWDKPAREADELPTLEAMLDAPSPAP
ncbi:MULTISPECIES: cisplatin damage response ATP-dependent DNA ligase [unclassified Brevundimonas]|uniref:cisplatin damage response ATP-dependent DNA ligase n=1 Tax=unclassified Brevundimonas TaxID=2622653 RepID=UPI000CFB0865|nr:MULTISPECIES: cisplatin damage response ATP-dependent DNA ligase [unclassified Brevundimonas]PRA28562.1 ATP-dependent DNA ligase [Brevundimonas sp. MYb27]PQZ84085.1 ATP-dependent DNA ligase [Brevundimonas sp. MYb31]PRB17942.1 ATP-dependent DNA ligase [Brevundimonas sp. MYb52]PRB35922.1 ATP-dependent DNA ligase [Brevundimonas sp. MYb46]PRB55906.1 ATP-dependent DNA ligase [Brevundimonas sp. MYb33]